MTMTPEAARKTWCHKAMVSVTDNETGFAVSINRYRDGGWPSGCECIADQCQAWDRADHGITDILDGECGLKRGRAGG